MEVTLIFIVDLSITGMLRVVWESEPVAPLALAIACSHKAILFSIRRVHVLKDHSNYKILYVYIYILYLFYPAQRIKSCIHIIENRPVTLIILFVCET